MILVDTSIWIDHWRTGDERLKSMLEAGQVLVHPFVVGELSLGNLAASPAGSHSAAGFATGHDGHQH